MNKKVVSAIVIFVILSGLVNFAFSESASAWVGRGDGNSGGGGSTNPYDPSAEECPFRENFMGLAYCAGVSWIYYEAVAPAGSVTFPTTGFVGAYRPADSAVIDAECSNNGNGGFWHFGVNGQAYDTGLLPALSNNFSNYSMSAYTWGHWTSWTPKLAKYTPYLAPGEGGERSRFKNKQDWNVGGLGQDLLVGGKAVYTARAYTTNPSDVLEDYKKALEREEAGSSAGVTSIGENVWAFCYWEDSYYGSSTGEATDEDDNTVVSEITTGIVGIDSETIVPSEINDVAEVSGVVNLKFKHNVYAEESGHEAWWRVSEVWLDTEKSTGKSTGFTMKNDKVEANNQTVAEAIANKQAVVDKVKFGNEKEGDYYIPDGDPVKNPVVEITLPVEFTHGGIYVFCQDLRMAESEEKLADAKVTSEVCIPVEVRIGYYGKSIVTAVSEDGATVSADTGIVEMDSKTTNAKPYPEIVLETGKGESRYHKVTLTFSHNIYADSPSGKVYWGVGRNNALVSNSTLTATYINSRPLRFLDELEAGYYKHGDVVGNVSFCDIYRWCSQCGGDVGCPIPGNSAWDGYESVGTNGFVKVDTAEISFYETDTEETYTFCDALYIADGISFTDDNSGYADGHNAVNSKMRAGNYTSQACVKVIVKPAVFEGSEAGSYVWSRVRNGRLQGDYEGWKGIKDEYDKELETYEDATKEDDDPEEGKGNVTYAKPTDKIDWWNTYASDAQGLYYSDVVEINGAIAGTHGAHSGCSFTTNTYVTLGREAEWTNNYFIDQVTPVSSLSFPREETPGEASVYDERYTYTVLQDEVGGHKEGEEEASGKPYYDLIATVDNTPVWAEHRGTYDHSWTCNCGYWWGDEWVPCTEEERHTNEYTWGNYVVVQLASKSYLKVPYNFINTASFSVDRVKTASGETVHDPVYPGETVDVSDVLVTVGPKENKVVQDTYATKVDNAKVRLIAYVSSDNQSENATGVFPSHGDDLCSYVDVVWRTDVFCETVNSEHTHTLTVPDDKTSTGYTHGGSETSYKILGTSFGGTYEVFDAKAGHYFCMTLGVYPATSGGDKNLDPKGDDSWYLYTPECIVIAKKPSFQIWGSGVYSAAGDEAIVTNVSQKSNLFKLENYRYGGTNSMVFGSWVEENVITVGKAQWLVSGASLGKNGKQDTKGGAGVVSISSVFCDKMTSLSFANYDKTEILGICPKAFFTGLSGISATNFETAANAGALAEYWVNGEPDDSSLDVGDLAEAGTPLISATSKDIRFINTTGAVTIDASELSENQTRIIKAGGVTINGNVRYDSKSHSTLNDLSKVIIYSSSDIDIKCGVNRVDAVLIARGTVNTCSDGGEDVNTEARSNQLVINGTIITSKLELNRTYGNAMGISDGGYVSDKVDGDNYEKHSVPGSETPAEIINYDMSLLLWGASMAGAGESNTLTVTYQHELAPRY